MAVNQHEIARALFEPLELEPELVEPLTDDRELDELLRALALRAGRECSWILFTETTDGRIGVISNVSRASIRALLRRYQREAHECDKRERARR